VLLPSLPIDQGFKVPP